MKDVSKKKMLCIHLEKFYALCFNNERYFYGFPKYMFVPLVTNKFFQDTDFKGVLLYSLINCVGP